MGRHQIIAKWPVGALAAVLVMLLSLGPATGQSSSPDGLRVVRVDQTGYPAVQATVSLPSALLGTPLPPGAFTVLEGSSARPVEATALGLNGIHLVLALDQGPDDATLHRVQGAALELIRLVMPEASLTIVAAGSPATLVLPATTDADAATAAVGRLRPVTGATTSMDTLSHAVDQVRNTTEARPVVVMLTGSATGSEQAARQLAGVASVAQIPVDVVIAGAEPTPPAFDLLARLGEGRITVGRGTGTSDFTEAQTTVAVLDRIVADLSSQYRLAFRMTGARTTPVTLRLQVNGVEAEQLLQLGPSAGPPSVGQTPTSTQSAPGRGTTAQTRSPGKHSSGSGWLGPALVVAAILAIGLLAIGTVALRGPAGAHSRRRQKARRLARGDRRARRARRHRPRLVTSPDSPGVATADDQPRPTVRGAIEPTEVGAHWWMYRRSEIRPARPRRAASGAASPELDDRPPNSAASDTG